MTSEGVNALKIDEKFFSFSQEVGVYHPHASSKQNTEEMTNHKKRIENLSWGKPEK